MNKHPLGPNVLAEDAAGYGAPSTRRGRISTRGFASMDPQRQREIASVGGRVAHAKGLAHQFTSEEAREAGRKGGLARAANRQRKVMEQAKSQVPPAQQT
jgi:general stress protein YciG